MAVCNIVCVNYFPQVSNLFINFQTNINNETCHIYIYICIPKEMLSNNNKNTIQNLSQKLFPRQLDNSETDIINVE